jgi:hypothetical protein
MASAALLSTGLLWKWASTGNLRFEALAAAPSLPRLLGDELLGETAAGRLRPHLLVDLGLTALVLTPYLRIVAAVALFAKARQRSQAIAGGLLLVVLTWVLFLR